MIDRATKLRSIEETRTFKIGGLMLGAKLRVKSRMADSCRANSSVSTLVLDTNGRFIDASLRETPARTLSDHDRETPTRSPSDHDLASWALLLALVFLRTAPFRSEPVSPFTCWIVIRVGSLLRRAQRFRHIPEVHPN